MHGIIGRNVIAPIGCGTVEAGVVAAACFIYVVVTVDLLVWTGVGILLICGGFVGAGTGGAGTGGAGAEGARIGGARTGGVWTGFGGVLTDGDGLDVEIVGFKVETF